MTYLSSQFVLLAHTAIGIQSILYLLRRSQHNTEDRCPGRLEATTYSVSAYFGFDPPLPLCFFPRLSSHASNLIACIHHPQTFDPFLNNFFFIPLSSFGSRLHLKETKPRPGPPGSDSRHRTPSTSLAV